MAAEDLFETQDIDQPQVRFTVLIESAASAGKSWDVALWHNFEHVDKWTSLSLQAAQQPNVVSPAKLVDTH